MIILLDTLKLALTALELTYQLSHKTLPLDISFSDVYNKQLSARMALVKAITLEEATVDTLKLLQGKLDLMTAERDKLYREIMELRTLRALGR